LADYFELSCKRREVALVWFRIFYVYGPGQRAESLIPSLINAFRTNRDPSINNLSAANDYIYVGDVVSAFAKAVEEDACSGIFNLGSGRLSSVADIVGLVERSIQGTDEFSRRLVETIIGPASGSSMWADISLSVRQIGWTPRVSLAEGIELSCGVTSDKKA
jgi:nucleoside-diphosphate-sugar epimerase